MASSTQFAYRTLKGIGLVTADPTYEPLPGFQRPEGNLRCCTYSPCGRYFAWASPEDVTIVEASAGNTISTLVVQNVYELGFSPRASFVITWERPSKDEEGNATKNLKVWKVSDADPSAAEGAGEQKSLVGAFVQRAQTGWNLQYTNDEQYCARVVTNEVQFYESGDLGTVWNKLRVEGVSEFALSPGNKHSVAVFIPERKGQPAAVKVFNVPNFSAPICQKTFFKGDKVQLKWNASGTNLIVLAQTEVDKTGKSYYGETNLYLLSADGEFDSRVQLDKEGPIHDVAWSPSSKQFGVVYGYMPAKTTIFNVRAIPTHNFPLAPRNTVIFSPHGRFVLVAGFGNLAGQIDVYDVDKDYHKVATIESGNPSVCKWSPDGKSILTATTSPRLRVDNGIKIWHVSGSLIYNEDLTELYDVDWRPGSLDDYPLSNPFDPAPTPHASALAYLGRVKTPSKPAGAYRPPGARGQVTPLHFKREDEGGAAHVSDGISSYGGAVNGFERPRRRDVPGAEAATALPPGAAPGGGISLSGVVEGDGHLSKTAAKNKKKREAKKAKEAGDRLAPTADDDDGSTSAQNRSPDRKGRREHARTGSRNNLHARSRSRRADGSEASQGSSRPGGAARPNAAASSFNNPSGNTAADRSNPPAAATKVDNAPDLTVTSPGGGTSEQKKLRGLLKKLRAIEDLKMRLAGGEKLEDTQMKKIGTEDSVRQELEETGWTG